MVAEKIIVVARPHIINAVSHEIGKKQFEVGSRREQEHSKLVKSSIRLLCHSTYHAI